MILRVLIGVALIGVTCVGVLGANFVIVDRAYARLTNAPAKTRTEIEATLRPLRGSEVVNHGEMAPNLAARIGSGDVYVRYTWFGSSHGIDVIYGRDGSVRYVWPEYE